jgi:hypothetical protein
LPDHKRGYQLSREVRDAKILRAIEKQYRCTRCRVVGYKVSTLKILSGAGIKRIGRLVVVPESDLQRSSATTIDQRCL